LALKKQNFAEGEIAIFDEACVYKRGEYWQFRLWLPKEKTNVLSHLRKLRNFARSSDLQLVCSKVRWRKGENQNE
jgi:hypothetical protein